MIDENLKEKIKILFKEKKFSKVIELTDKINPENRSAGLENIIGISKYSDKNLSLKDAEDALSCFERAFLKEKKSIHGFHGLMNLIKVGIKVSSAFNNFSFFLYRASEHYLGVQTEFKKNEEFLENGISLFSYLLDHKNLNKISKEILNSECNSIFLRGVSIFHNNYSYEWKQSDHLKFAKNNSKYFTKLKTKNLNNIYKINKRINLGLVGCDFEKNHSTTYFLKDTIKYLDTKKFNLFIFSITKKNLDDRSQNELRNLVQNWCDVYEFDNQNLVSQIQNKKIDILIDLIGYTKPNRLELFNSRIAPKQVSWLAYCNTTGLENIDYLIADNNLILKDEEQLYSEKIIKLPYIWSAHSGFEKKLNQEKSYEKKTFNFGSFNNFKKISNEVVKTWSKILQQTSNSKLILKSSTPCDRDSIFNKFREYNVDDKIEILNKLDYLDKDDHLNLYKKIDLSLDTFPYNGVTTTFEALWMNVPVLVKKGFNFNSRCGESIIKNLNLKNLIAENDDDYIFKAINLYKNKQILKTIKKNLNKNLMKTPLFNTRNFSQNFSEALIKIYNS